jgi:threonine dehydrogenase-like Zn-dependent dehydrogenase
MLLLLLAAAATVVIVVVVVVAICGGSISFIDELSPSVQICPHEFVGYTLKI